MTKEEYNQEPVFFCKSCHSLKIKTVAIGSDLDYCDDCGSTDIDQTDINEWERVFEERFGFKYINN